MVHTCHCFSKKSGVTVCQFLTKMIGRSRHMRRKLDAGICFYFNAFFLGPSHFPRQLFLSTASNPFQIELQTKFLQIIYSKVPPEGALKCVY